MNKEKIKSIYFEVETKLKLSRYKFQYASILLILIAIPFTLISLNMEQDLRSNAAADPEVLAVSTKPNIVIIMFDDMNPFDGRLFKSQRTPVINDTFIKKGITFTNYFVETSLCCPGRAGYLTGQHTHNHGVNNLNGRKLNPSVTLATELQSAGYYTIYSGKYLNQYTSFPVNQRIPVGWDKFDAIFNNNGAYFNYDAISTDGTIKHYGTSASDYSTDVFGNRAINSLKNAPADKPVMIFYSPYAPHDDETPAPRHRTDSRCSNVDYWKLANYNEGDVSDKPLYVRTKSKLPDSRGYDLKSICRTVLSVEDNFKKLKTELQNQGRLDNTIFILTADNGDARGEHRLFTKKTTPYSTRVPFYASWIDGRGSEPKTVGAYLTNIDLAPTLCAIAGCTMGPYPNGQQSADGISFASILENQPFTNNRDAILETQSAYWDNKDEEDPGTMPLWYSVRTTPKSSLGLWRYTEYANGERELYNLSNGPCYAWVVGSSGDPCELKNLLGPGSNPTKATLDLVSKLKARLNQLKVEKGSGNIPTGVPSASPTVTPSVPTFTPTPTTASLNVSSGQITTSLTATADTVSRSDNPSTNYGKITSMKADSNPVSTSFIRFNTSNLKGKNISKAVLTLKVFNSSDAGNALNMTVAVNSVGTDWTESGLTYNNKPALGQQIGTILGPNAQGKTIEVDVTSALKGINADSYAVALSTNNGDSLVLNTREMASGKPTLKVTYE